MQELARQHDEANPPLPPGFFPVYKVARVKQSWATGIRPGERIFFELEYAEMPLEDTRFIRIILAYEQDQWAIFDIPAEVFFGGMAGRSQYYR